MCVSFNVVVEQLRVVNPDVNLAIEGTDLFYRVVDGKIVIPEELANEDDQEKGDDAWL